MAARVARVYGDAYVSLAVEGGQVKGTMEEVVEVSQMLENNEDFLRLLHHPEITVEEKIAISDQLLHGHVSDQMTGFVLTIIRKGRSKEMSEIFAYIIEQLKKIQHIGSLEVIAATELSADQKQEIEGHVLSSTSYETLETTYKVDTSLIGGLVLSMDHRVVDSSIRSKLEQMKKELSSIQLS